MIIKMSRYITSSRVTHLTISDGMDSILIISQWNEFLGRIIDEKYGEV